MDESNDHVLSVWDWAKESKVVDSKVRGLAFRIPSLRVSSQDMLGGHAGTYGWESATRLILNGGFGVICWMTADGTCSVSVGSLLWKMRSTVVSSSQEVERLGRASWLWLSTKLGVV